MTVSPTPPQDLVHSGCASVPSENSAGDAAHSLLRKRVVEIERHCAKYPNSLDRSPRETADAIVVLLNEVDEMRSRIGVMTSRAERCPQCADTKRTCANIIAEFQVKRRQALKGRV